MGKALSPLNFTLLTWRIWWAPNNAKRWQMGLNSGFKVLECPLTLTLLTWTIWWAPNNASRWQMGFNSAFKGLKYSLTLILLKWRIWWAPNNASKRQMEFNSASKVLRNLENGALRWYGHAEWKVGGRLVGKVSYPSLTGRRRKWECNEEEYYEDQEVNGNVIVSVEDKKFSSV